MPEKRTPKLADIIVVRTPSRAVGGEVEHAAIVTMVHSPSVVSAHVFYASGDSRQMQKITAEANIDRDGGDKANGWRWPERGRT